MFGQAEINSNQEVSMRRKRVYGSVFVAITFTLGGLLVWLTAARAQTVHVTGQARALAANVRGTTTFLADTGTLAGANDERDASLETTSIPALLSGEVLSAGTLSWPDEVDSEASLANLSLTVGGNSISADFALAQASATLSAKSSGSSTIDGLSINGSAVAVTGAPNQKVTFPGGVVTINEQYGSANLITVNALHVHVPGVGDVVIGSATAGIN
jgi:hypothetical protein